MRKTKRIILYIFILGFAALIYSFIEPFWLQTKEVTISSKDIPASFNDVRLVFVADIHHGPYFSRSRVLNLVERINALNPDIVLLGGDYVHREPKYIEPCFEELSNLKATIGKYGVLGNHDHWESAELTRQFMENAGIEIMDNRATWINKSIDRIKIGGVGDMFEDRQDINPTIDDVKENDFVMLLSHSPDYAEQIKTKKIDLVLSGHTHGGQVTLFGLWAPLIPSKYGQKYRTGIIETDYTKVLVTNGVGTITPPVRFFARPEIVLIHLKSEAIKGLGNKTEFRKDKQPLSDRFPMFGNFEECYWQAGTIGQNSRISVPGPTSYWMKGFIVLNKNDFEKLKNEYQWKAIEADWNPEFETDMLQFKSFRWYKSDIFDTKASSLIGHYYLDFDNGVIFFDVEK